MALDEPKDEDDIMENAGIKFVLDNQTKDILAQSGGLIIDYVDESYRRGYMLRLGAPGEGGGGCGTGGGGCEGCG
jgi:Fe-S cluster assembly iron-binding protein IscA